MFSVYGQEQHRTPLSTISTTQITPSTPYLIPNNTFPSYPASLSATPSTPTASRGQHPSRKRKNKENLDDILPDPKKRRAVEPVKPQLTNLEKISLFYGFLKHELKWTYGELLYHTAVSISHHNRSHREAVAAAPGERPQLQWQATEQEMNGMMRHFFEGSGKFYPAKIMENWYSHPYGSHERDSESMFSVSTPYTTIRAIRPAMSAFAAQLVQKRLVQEAEKAVESDSGLHVTLASKKTASKKIQWTDIGATTMELTQSIIEKHQPLTWSLILKLAARPPRRRNGVTAVRVKRPPNLITTGVISALNFSRTSRAKLLPLASGLMLYGSQVSSDVFRYQSRMALVPCEDSVKLAMQDLSAHEAAVTEAHGQDPGTMGVIRLDNVQNYLLQRDPGIGRENKLNIGLAATYYEVDLEGINIDIFNLEEKQKAVDQCLRKTLTVDKLYDLIDDTHIERICILQWINTLIKNIPSLSHLAPEVKFAYSTRVAKQKLKVQRSKVHPLASSSFNETILTELKHALDDFSNQAGHTRESGVKPRLFPIGGDGLTYEKMLELKEYLQLHPNDFDAMRTLQPLLEWWHTEWTNLSRIFECYWGELLSKDPSTLGHSAAKIGRKKPPNLKKVDFFTGTDLAYLVLDVRILDCWRPYYGQNNLKTYFEELAKEKKLPAFDDLETAALQLYRSYTSQRAQQRAMRGKNMETRSLPPVADIWPISEPVPVVDSAKEAGKRQKKKPTFQGDQILAKSIGFMRETMIAREMTLATAQGDPGRIWEVVKTMLFTFAVSKYDT